MIVHQGRSGGLSWRYAAWSVAKLHPHVEAMVGYEELAPGHAVLRCEVPRPGALILAQLEPRVRLGADSLAMPRAFVVGGLGRSLTPARFDERQSGLEIALSPLGASSVLGVSADELAGRVFALDELVPAAASLALAVVEASTWRDRFARLEHWIAERIAASRHDYRLSAWVARMLEASGGCAVERECSWSPCSSPPRGSNTGRISRKWSPGRGWS